MGFEMTFPQGVTESDFDAIKSALATVLGVNPSDITLSLKTTMKRQSVTTTASPATIVVATVMGTKETAAGIEMKIEEMTFVADVNNKLPSGPTLNSVSDPVVDGSTVAPMTTGPTSGPMTTGPTTGPMTNGPMTTGPTSGPMTTGPMTTGPTSGPMTTGPMTTGQTTMAPTTGPTTAGPTTEAPTTVTFEMTFPP